LAQRAALPAKLAPSISKFGSGSVGSIGSFGSAGSMVGDKEQTTKQQQTG
jgi:hypothetical protein